MMTKYAHFFVVAVLLTFMGSKVNAKEYESPAYTQYVAEITRSFSKQIEKEFGVECEGSGGEMPYDIEEISIKFAAYQRATVEQARELEVKITERFVQCINAHEKIRPFLREKPFPANRTSVAIAFYNRNNKRYTDGSVSYVSQINSRIYYRAEDPANPYVYKHIKDEPYEEARKIVEKNAAKNPHPQSKNL